jgi:hypothetical protein
MTDEKKPTRPHKNKVCGGRVGSICLSAYRLVVSAMVGGRVVLPTCPRMSSV